MYMGCNICGCIEGISWLLLILFLQAVWGSPSCTEDQGAGNCGTTPAWKQVHTAKGIVCREKSQNPLPVPNTPGTQTAHCLSLNNLLGCLHRKDTARVSNMALGRSTTLAV